MLDNKKTDDIYKILSEYKLGETKISSYKLGIIPKISGAGILVNLFIAIIITISGHFYKSEWQRPIALLFTILSQISAIIFTLSSISPQIIMIFKPIQSFYSNLKNELEKESELAIKLEIYPLVILEYSHKRLRMQINTIRNRCHFLVGVIEKIGIIPLIFSIFFSIQNIMNESDFFSEWSWLIYSLITLYFSGLYVAVLTINLEEKLSILESVIEIIKTPRKVSKLQYYNNKKHRKIKTIKR